MARQIGVRDTTIYDWLLGRARPAEPKRIVNSTIAAEILDISPEDFRKQLSRAKAHLFQFIEAICGLINPRNPCRCYKKTKGFIREGKVDVLTQQFFPEITETIHSVAGRKNEELDALMEGKYLRSCQFSGTSPKYSAASSEFG